MKYRNIYILMAALSLLSCTKEKEQGFLPAEGQMRFAVTVEGSTKASMTGADLTQFYLKVNGPDAAFSFFDSIVKDEQGNWNASSKRLVWKDEESSITYAAASYGTLAYYNEITVTDDVFTSGAVLPVLPDQSTQERLNAADLLTMVADTLSFADSDGGLVPVTLKHGLSKVNFVLTLDGEFYDNGIGLETDPLTDVVVSGVKRSFDFKPMTGEVSVPDTVQAGTVIPFAGGYVPGTEEAPAAKATYECVLAPQELAAGALKLSFSLGTADFEWTNAAELALAQNKEYTVLVSVKYKEPTPDPTPALPVTDLSMVDCAGNARAEGKMWTANCYMVHTAGDYKLPLVYGNAIKDGAANSNAYTGIENTKTTLTFPNHAGTAINAPWITKAATGEGVNKGMGIAVSSAELLWQDAEGLITAVGIDGDYLTLTVGKDATAQEGNAVIAAKTSDGTVVWSWHIWVTKETFATLTTVATGSHNYQVTPVNLGWVATGGDGKQGYGTFYQWGRKDAFIPSTGTAITDHTVYDIENGTVTGLPYTSNTTATIADNIQNPTTHYYSNSGPCNTTYYNMWDAQNTENDNVTTATKKTVYDPCPPGFCVPTSNLYYYANIQGALNTSWDDTNKGRTWQGIFFPASGRRSNISGAISFVGVSGYYWSASPYTASTCRNLTFGSGDTWGFSSFHRSYGYSVRAVAEE